jgi:hypothetical protein
MDELVDGEGMDGDMRSYVTGMGDTEGVVGGVL